MITVSHIRHRCVRIYQSYFPQPLSEQEHVIIKEKLNERLQGLFYAQPLCDQRHGLLVYEKAQRLFQEVDPAPTDDELFLASCFHDVAKKDCRFSVTQRVFVATLLALIPVRRHDGLRSSRSKFIRRIGIYVDHAELSWEMISKETDSEFVRSATVFHHGYPKGSTPTPDQVKNLELFVLADTL